MKKTLQFKQKMVMSGIFFVFLSTILVAQNNFATTSSIDIKAMVRAEISKIKNKNSVKVENKKENLIIKNSVIPKKSVSKISALQSFYLANKSVCVKAFVLIEASILAALVVLWRRRNQEFYNKREKFFKDNIKNIREEKIIPLEDFEEVQNRSKLIAKRIKDITNGKSITKLAKKLSVSKGELYLAAKIKLLTKS